MSDNSQNCVSKLSSKGSGWLAFPKALNIQLPNSNPIITCCTVFENSSKILNLASEASYVNFVMKNLGK